MITDIFLKSLKALLDFILSPFLLQSDVVLPEGFTQAIHNVQGIYSSVSPVFPLGTLLAIIALVVSVELAILAYKFTTWIIKKVPTIS